MDIAISKLKDAEVVLMNKIKRMKDGKPKYEANDQLRNIRHAIELLESVHGGRARVISTLTDTVY